MINKRGELILKSYLKYNSNMALGFWSSRVHAEYMAKNFNDNGMKSGGVISESNSEHYIARNEAIKLLEDGEEYCLSENLKSYVTNDAFKKHFKDIIDYRTKRYYKERVEKK